MIQSPYWTTIYGDGVTKYGSQSADVTIDYGKSDIYTAEDMDNAIALIKDEPYFDTYFTFDVSEDSVK